MSIFSRIGGLLSNAGRSIAGAARNTAQAARNAAQSARQRIQDAFGGMRGGSCPSSVPSEPIEYKVPSEPIEYRVPSSRPIDLPQNRMFREQMRTAGTDISPFTKGDQHVFWRATQDIWENVPFDRRYDAIFDYFHEKYGFDTFEEIYDYVMDVLGNRELVDEWDDTDDMQPDTQQNFYDTQIIAMVKQVVR